MEKPKFLPIAILLTLAVSSDGALLLYEGFDGYGDGDQAPAITPNSNTFGIEGSYANTATNADGPVNTPTMLRASSTGISFGSLVTSGGSLSIAAGTGVAQTNITTTTSSSIIWGSYLVNLSGNSAGSATGSHGFEVRLNSNPNSSAGSAYFRSNADARAHTGAAPGIAYDNGIGPAGSVPLDLNTDYIIISKFDTGPSGGASMWALNLTQFEAFVEAGRTEAFLNADGNVTVTATDAQAGPKTWHSAETAAYLEIVTSSTTAAGAVTGRVDEIRYGEELVDVTPVIPEPSSTLLMGAGVLLTGLRRRR